MPICHHYRSPTVSSSSYRTLQASANNSNANSPDNSDRQREREVRPIDTVLLEYRTP